MRFLACDAALVMVKVKGVDAGLRLQARAFEAAFDGAAVARFQFHIGEPFQRGGHAEILGGGLRDRRLQLAAHRRQIQLMQFLFEGASSDSFPDSRMKASYASSDNGSVTSSFNRGSRRRSGGCGRRGDCCWRRMLAT